MIAVTTGDIFHLIGGFGTGENYTVRLALKLSDPIDESMLRYAVENTQKRYPYLSLRLLRNESTFYYEQNDLPVTLHHTKERITLNSEETNYHVWAVCYDEDQLFLDISHGICDGTGMYMILSTLLYYYCHKKYGVTDHSGIRILEDPVLAEESIDPLDHLPQLDPSMLQRKSLTEAFSLIEDAGLTPSDDVIYDIVVDEKSFVRFTSANDASPGTMVCILLSRAIDSLFPERNKPLISTYICNGRPMLGAQETHHNCSTGISFTYSDKVKAMPFDRQCTVHRGTTFIQSDPDRVRGVMTYMASANRMMMQMAPTADAKKQAFARNLLTGRQISTFLVSYIGQWKKASLAPYVKEFWTHVPTVSGNLAVEIAAINGRIFLSLHQRFSEDCIVQAFLEQLREHGIPYDMKGPFSSDVAGINEPVE